MVTVDANKSPFKRWIKFEVQFIFYLGPKIGDSRKIDLKQN